MKTPFLACTVMVNGGLQMKIGVLADSHDRLEAISLAVAKFNREGVQHVFHAGDVISPFTTLSFKPLKAQLHLVWGNNDGDKFLLRDKFGGIKASIHGTLMKTELYGRRIAMNHGTYEAIVRNLIDTGEYDLVITGHTHKPEIIWEGKTLVVNPGAASGYLAQEKTVATVDLKTMKATLLTLT